MRCPGCATDAEVTLVQSINPRDNPADKKRLLAGELNVLDCASCGKRTQLAANVLFQEGDYYCQVVPGGETAMKEAAAAFAVSGVSGTQRLVPSLNALIEKVKILDAGLLDWAVEMTKVLLLSSIGELDRVLLFATVDRDKHVLQVGPVRRGLAVRRAVSSPLDALREAGRAAPGRSPNAGSIARGLSMPSRR